MGKITTHLSFGINDNITKKMIKLKASDSRDVKKYQDKKNIWKKKLFVENK